MTTPTSPESSAAAPREVPGFDWEAAGRQLGVSLDAFHAVVVTGVDPTATGLVALGVGRAQSDKRRVAVGDLFAESPPIQALANTDDPHGIVDSFLYGVSLGRIAREVPGAGQLFVLPSGSEPPAYEEMLPNPRWGRLMAGFHEVGALLVLAVPARAAHVEDLATASDGVVLVGESVPSAIPASIVIASIRAPREGAPARERPIERTARRSPVTPVAALPPASVAPAPRRWPRWVATSAPGIVAFIGLAAIAAWLAWRPMARIDFTTQGAPPDTANPPRVVVPSNGTVAAPSDSAAPLRVMNLEDSAQASAFAVELTAANTEAGAILKLQQDGKNLPAATFAPVLVQGTRWFRVLSGAFVDRADADSLLAGLRRRGLLDPSSGAVVRRPLAFLIESDLPAAAVPGMMTTYADHGLPVYALRQADGTAWLLVGAFESVEESSLYAQSLRASGITPVLVYRKGRTF